MINLKRLTVIVTVVLLAVGCDQGTKVLAEQHLVGAGTLSFLGGIVRLHYSENPGALLSLGARLSATARFWIFTVSVAVVLLVLLLYLLRDKSLRHSQVIALSLILGGGASNLIDRVINDGAVIDFLNLGLGGLRTGIFNVADVAVFAGVGLFWLQYAKEQPVEEPAKSAADTAPAGQTVLSPDHNPIDEMDREAFERAIYDRWAAHFGCSITDLHQPGIDVIARQQNAGNDSIHIWHIGERAFVIVDPALADEIEPALQRRPHSARLTAEEVKASLGPGRLSESLTCLVYYLYPADMPEVFGFDAGFEIRHLTPDDAGQMETLKAATPPAEVREAFVEVDHRVAFGMFAGNQLVAAASGYESRGFLDLGVLTHPDYRRQGLGTAVVAELCCWAFDHDMIPQYRHDVRNTASARLAESLNFTRYFRQDSVRLTPPD